MIEGTSLKNKWSETISIIVPVYNVKEYVEKCIQSIINQRYAKIEVILVDDGSTDGSGEICNKYAQMDSRIVVIHQKNGGLSEARNSGLARARGAYIGFVDGDDWIHPQMYEIMLKILQTEGVDLVTCDFEQMDEEGFRRSVGEKEVPYSLMTGTEAMNDIETPLVVAWNKLYKKEILKDIRYPKERLHEDEFIIHRVLRRCDKIAIIKVALYFYTVRPGSIVAKMTERRMRDALSAFSDRIEFAEENNWNEVMKTAVTRYCEYCMSCYYNIKDGKYELDAKNMRELWKLENNMVKKYAELSLEKKYVMFAKKPIQYEKWLEIRDKRYKISRLIYGCLLKIKRKIYRN